MGIPQGRLPTSFRQQWPSCGRLEGGSDLDLTDPGVHNTPLLIALRGAEPFASNWRQNRQNKKKEKNKKGKDLKQVLTSSGVGAPLRAQRPLGPGAATCGSVMAVGLVAAPTVDLTFASSAKGIVMGSTSTLASD